MPSRLRHRCGVLLPLAWLDHTVIVALLDRLLGRSSGLLLTGSAVGLIFAYLVRFLAVSLQTVDASLTNIPPSLDDAARSLGASGSRAPACAPAASCAGLLTALILVFVEVMKEMPATLLLRPFGLNTLAVEVWKRTSEAMWQEAAVPALAIVAAGVLPVLLLRLAARRSAARLHGAPERLSRLPSSPPRLLSRGGSATLTHLSGGWCESSSLAASDQQKLPARGAGAARHLLAGGETGTVVCLLGPSGCGKTTLLRLVAGFEEPDAGEIYLIKRLVSRPGLVVPPEQRHIGMVFQDYALFPHMTVSQNIQFGLFRWPAAWRRAFG